MSPTSILAREIQEIGDRLERIIDLMSDSGSEAPGRRQFFIFAQGLFGARLGGDVANDGRTSRDCAVRSPQWGE